MRFTPEFLRKALPVLVLPLSAGPIVPRILEAQTSLSLQTGVSLATLAGDAENADYRTGLRVGASAIVPLSSSLGLQLGAAYAAKGATAEEFVVDVALELGYLEIPLLLTLSPSVEGTISPRFSVGPALSFRISCSADAGAEGVQISLDCDSAEFDEEIKRIDVGAVAGAGLDIATPGSVSVSLDVLYNLGLVSVFELGDTKNRAFSILAGITIPIG